MKDINFCPWKEKKLSAFLGFPSNSKIILSFVKASSFFNSRLETFLFSLQNETSIKWVMNKWINGYYWVMLFISGPFIIRLTNILGYPAVKNLFLISFFSWWKLELILHERYRSPFIAFLLYLFWDLRFPMCKNLLALW